MEGTVEDTKESINARRQSVIRRIIGLMAKTIESGCTEEEAVSAANLASSLMAAYELSLSDIQLKEQANCQEGSVNTGFKSDRQNSFLTVTAIGYLTDTKVWSSLRGNHRHAVFFGFETDVIVAKYIFAIIDRAMNYATVRHAHFYEGFNSLPRARQHQLNDSFQVGMASRLASRLRKMKEDRKDEAASSGRSLVVVKASTVDEEFHKIGVILADVKSKARKIDDQAYASGSIAADKVQFNSGIGAARAPEKIS